MGSENSPKTTRRRWLFLMGLGAAGTALGTGKLFAKQFARATTPVQLPDMVYDPKLQMMVDPVTRQPVYARANMMSAQDGGRGSSSDDDKKSKDDKSKPKDGKSKAKEPENNDVKAKPKPNPTVTAGCSNCPKCDDNCG
jgi:hypothetical protein